MAIERVINYVVGADGKVSCNGTRRPQSAGVQGDDGVCKLIFDMSAVYTGKERYFIEFVCGCGTPIILSEDSDGVEFDTQVKKLNVVLGKEITSEGATVEVQIVEEVLDVENNATVEGNTYVTYIEFQNKSGVMTKLKETAYGIFLDCKNILQKAVNMLETAKQKYDDTVQKFEAHEEGNDRLFSEQSAAISECNSRIAELNNNKASVEYVNGSLAQKRDYFTVDDSDDNKTGLGFGGYSGTDVLYVKRDGDTIITDEYGNLKVNPDAVISPEQYADGINNIIDIINEDRDRISGNAEKLEQNTNDIEGLRGAVSENTDRISNNAKTIEKNASDVAQNYANAVKGTGTGTAIAFDDVSPINHKVKISGTAGDRFRVFGKNLWNSKMKFANRTLNGLTLVNNDDGTVTISGTPTAKTTFITTVSTSGYTILAIGVYSCDSTLLNFNTYTVADNTLKQFRGGKITATEPLKVAQAYVYFDDKWVDKEVNFTFNMQLNVGVVYDTEYVPYQVPVSYYLDENGNVEIDSAAPNMTILADNEVSVTYNRDTSKVINQLLIDNKNLKNAVISLGGSL